MTARPDSQKRRSNGVAAEPSCGRPHAANRAVRAARNGYGEPAGESQRRESNPQPPHYECGALPIEATLAKDVKVTVSCPPAKASLVERVSVRKRLKNRNAPPAAIATAGVEQG